MRSRRRFIRDAALATPIVASAWSRSISQGLDQRIQRMVVLMLENRSFDHMLGFAFRADLNVQGFPSDLSTLPQNLDGSHEPVRPLPEMEYAGDLYPDPGHDYEDVTLQIFNAPGLPTGSANMQGFVKSYLAMCQLPENVRLDRRSPESQSKLIMNAYAKGKLPILETLAREYAVCDRWFCSRPWTHSAEPQVRTRGYFKGPVRYVGGRVQCVSYDLRGAGWR